MHFQASRVHPSDITLNFENISQGYAIAELLCSLSGDYFDDDFLDRVLNDKDTSMAGAVRRLELIRQHIQQYYLLKHQRKLENAPLFFVPASDIGKL
jgi:hypothetical protein